jgi:hypothetical protein
MLHTDIPHESLGDETHLGIFDNTALGAATADELAVKSYLLDSQRVTI